MKRFAYLRDPLFLACCALYVLNRFLIKPHAHLSFFHSWFSDVLLIPCALPPVLWLHRRLGLRGHDRQPTVVEIGTHLAGWSVLFEVIGPHLMRHATGDVMDVVAYAVGAVVACVWWHSWRISGPAPQQNEL